MISSKNKIITVYGIKKIDYIDSDTSSRYYVRREPLADAYPNWTPRFWQLEKINNTLYKIKRSTQ